MTEVPGGVLHADLHSGVIQLHSGVILHDDEESMVDLESLVEVLTRIELDVAYFSEKLANLDLYLTNLSLRQNNHGASSLEADGFSAEDVEEALLLDLSCSYIGSEVEELGCFLDDLQHKILKAGLTISALEEIEEFSTAMQEKLQGSESSLKNLKDQMSEIKKQLSLLEGSFSLLGTKSSYSLPGKNYTGLKLDAQITEQQKIVLQMLEKSLARELDLEKKLLELKHNNEEQKLKLFHADQILSTVEAASEVAWGRLLEAENTAEVFKGIAKEMMSKLQIAQFSLNNLIQREEELKFRLQASLDQLKDTETRLKRANAICEASKKEISDMENVIDDLRGNVFMAESKSEALETKLATVTLTNKELTEELGFLKSGADGKEENIGLLEKRLRDLETQLNHAKVTSEASQEQQNMLYSAIWDMETLIEDLKSKVSKAEARAEDAEEQCLVLAETNMELNKEICDLKSRTENLEKTVNLTQRAKLERVKDIDKGAKLVTDMAMRLAIERERIHKQLSSLVRENKILMEELRRAKKVGSKAKPHSKEGDEKGHVLSMDSSENTPTVEASAEEQTGPLSTSDEVCEPPKDSGENEIEIGSVQPVNDAVPASPEQEAVAKEQTGNLGKKCVLMAFFVLTSSAIAFHMSERGIFSALRVHLGQQ